MKRIMTAAMGVLLALSVRNASAQSMKWNDLAFVNVSGGYQSHSQDLTDNFSFPLYGETASVAVARHIDGGGIFDITAGARVWHNLGVAFSYSQFSHPADGALTGSIPDPIFFNANRSVTSTVAGMQYKEKVFAPLLVWAMPLTKQLDVFILVGPADGKISVDSISGVTEAESGGGPQVTATRATTTKSYIGAQAGVDIRYMVMKQIGVGGFLRYNGARGNLDGSTKAIIGGFQTGGGLRVGF